MKDGRIATGRIGEAMAGEHLMRLGWQLIEKNWRCKAGEIDIIARDGQDLVFVEVRTRTSTRFGTGAESVDWRKQKRLRTLAGIYLSARQRNLRIRFDLISIQLGPNGQAHAFEHIRNAF